MRSSLINTALRQRRRLPRASYQHHQQRLALSSASTDSTTPPISLYAWGKNIHGAIPGAGDAKIVDHPQKVNIREGFGLDESSIPSMTQFTCGYKGSAVIFSNGDCYTWGENSSGQLGHGDKINMEEPKLVSLAEDGIGVRSISLGPSASALIDSNGDLHTFGFGGSTLSGGMGLLGHGDGASYEKPVRVESLVEDGCSVDSVTVGESHMSVLTTEGEVLTAGNGSYGRLGNLEAEDQLYFEPVEMLANTKIVQISGGHAFSLALADDGIIHCWGRNDKGQLGVGGGMMVDIYAMENLPRPVEGQLEGRKVIKIAAGNNHAAAIAENGELFTWGMGMYLEPQIVSTLGHSKCVDVVCGHNYTIVLTEDGQLYSVGKNKTGVLGHANTKTLTQPELIEGMVGNNIISMSAGEGHVACLVQEEQL